ncbi:anti-sigma regulatory factor [Lagierella sp.]|uniref:anti-sigma regulatory factor n=1 Tax=Lagierella sp. TaxID=2849657 RepID=UPI00260E71C6|nr:anti-sigma regulatory factor [Lagierella sp.]
MKKYYLSFENTPENFSLARLTVSFIANSIGFNIEEVEDIKVSISEALNLQLGISKEVKIVFYSMENRLEIDVIALDPHLDREGESNKFAKIILETLMDEVKIEEGIIKISKTLKD